MGARAKAILPLGVVIGVLSFGWCEVSLNSQFHWITNGDLGVGLALPANFQLIVWIAFVSWGLFFAAGGDTAAFGKIAIASIFFGRRAGDLRGGPEDRGPPGLLGDLAHGGRHGLHPGGHPHRG